LGAQCRYLLLEQRYLLLEYRHLLLEALRVDREGSTKDGTCGEHRN
jgi:hypothetical protein